MKTPLRSLPLLLAFALPAPLSAAILTVGPGGAYAEIADAVAAAQPNDVILVAPGTYQRFEVGKPLRILGDGTGDVIVTSAADRAIVVTGIAAGLEVVIAGVEVRAQPFFAPVAASVHVVACAGTVVLHDVKIDHPFNFIGLQVDDSARVMLLASEIPNGGPTSALRANGSEVWIVDSLVRAKQGTAGFVEPGYDAIALQASTLRVWRSTITGGDASLGKPAFGLKPDGGDGIDAVGSTVHLYGGGLADVRGGDGATAGIFSENGDGGAGIRLAGGSHAFVQHALVVAGGFDGTGTVQAPAIVADAGSGWTVDSATYPLVSASPAQASVGGAVQLQLEGTAGAVAVVFVSLRTGPTLTIPGVLGVGALDPGLFAQLAIVALDPLGTATIPAALPANPALLGATIFVQCAEAAGAQVAITNPAVVTVTQ